MDGVDIGDFCCGDDAWDVEVGVFCGSWADADFFVCLIEVGCVFVCCGVDADGFDVEFFAGADDSECDFATVCDEDSLEHGGVSLVSNRTTCRTTGTPPWTGV